MNDYYDRGGRPIDLMQWTHLHKDYHYIVVEKTPLVTGTNEADAEPVEVSTVWLGLNHNFTMQGPPLIFETMIFGGKFDEYMWRYATEREAQEGHEKIVQMLRILGKVPDE